MLIRMDSFESFTDRVGHRVSGRVRGFKSLRMQPGAQDAKDPSYERNNREKQQAATDLPESYILGRSSARGGSLGRSCQLSRARQFERLALMATIRAQDYTFVTSNRSDFLALHGQEPLHAGMIIIVPNVMPARQRELFSAARKHIGARDLTNTMVEVQYAGTRIVCSEYDLPNPGQ